ncbi:hypothetical protein AB0L00_44555 [Actinoallomurus sp. NPDC052308]|uniref:hypothetical protein n=1 Tax=Actinoallomurus sp. NPDC052308 TaxID=3155530 RepID=UPI0034417A50
MLRERGVDLDVLDEDRPVDAAAAGDSPLKGRSVVITGAFTDPRSGARRACFSAHRVADKSPTEQGCTCPPMPH